MLAWAGLVFCMGSAMAGIPIEAEEIEALMNAR